MTDFAQMRWQEDVAAWIGLAGCYTPKAALNWQQRFVERATKQNSEEMAKLSQMVINMAQNGAAAPQR